MPKPTAPDEMAKQIAAPAVTPDETATPEGAASPVSTDPRNLGPGQDTSPGPAPGVLQPVSYDTSDDEQEYVPGPIGRGLQSALIQSAFESFGQAFEGGSTQGAAENAPGMSAWRQAGDNVAKALEMRYYQAELVNFNKRQVKNFAQQADNLKNQSRFLNAELDRGVFHEIDGSVTYYDPETPDGRAKILMARGRLEADTISKLGDLQVSLSNEAASKYGDNPLINKQVANLYMQASTALLSRFNPENSLAAGQSMANIRQSEAQAANQQASARATQAEDRVPKTLRAAYQIGGVEGLSDWMNGTVPGQTMWANVREPLVNEVIADAKARYWKEHPNLTEQQKEIGFNNSLNENRSRFEKIGQWKWVASTLGEDVAKELQAKFPAFGPDPDKPLEPAVKGSIKPNEMKDKAEKWGKLALNKYEEYMSLAEGKNLSREDGIDYVLNDWFKNALTGGSKEEGYEMINQELTASDGQSAQKYRQYVTEYLKSLLRKHAGEGASQLPPEQQAPSRRGVRGNPVTRGGRALGRFVGNLFDETTYAPNPDTEVKQSEPQS